MAALTAILDCMINQVLNLNSVKVRSIYGTKPDIFPSETITFVKAYIDEKEH